MLFIYKPTGGIVESDERLDSSLFEPYEEPEEAPKEPPKKKAVPKKNTKK